MKVSTKTLFEHPRLDYIDPIGFPFGWPVVKITLTKFAQRVIDLKRTRTVVSIAVRKRTLRARSMV